MNDVDQAYAKRLRCLLDNSTGFWHASFCRLSHHVSVEPQRIAARPFSVGGRVIQLCRRLV